MFKCQKLGQILPSGTSHTPKLLLRKQHQATTPRRLHNATSAQQQHCCSRGV